MGIFDSRTYENEEIEKEIKSYRNFKSDIQNNNLYSDDVKKVIISSIDLILEKKTAIEVMMSCKEFSVIINLMLQHIDKRIFVSRFSSIMTLVYNIYDQVVSNKYDSKQIQLFLKIIKIGVTDNFNILRSIFEKNKAFYVVFEDKDKLLSFLNIIPSDINVDFIDGFLKYAIEARMFYIDENVYFIRLTQVLNKYCNNKYFSNVYAKEMLKEDRRFMFGSEVSQKTVEELELRMTGLKAMLMELKQDLLQVGNVALNDKKTSQSTNNGRVGLGRQGKKG